MTQINPLPIIPLGPYPDVQEGYESDWNQLTPGEVKHPRVLEAQSKL